MSDEIHSSTDRSTIDGESFKVLINAEEQYSIWPAGGAVPAGWTAVGPVGSRDECTTYIEAHWTDMRPLSLRAALDGDAGGKTGPTGK